MQSWTFLPEVLYVIASGSATNLMTESPIHKNLGAQAFRPLCLNESPGARCREPAGWLALLTAAGRGLELAGVLAVVSGSLGRRGVDCEPAGAVDCLSGPRDPDVLAVALWSAAAPEGLGLDVALGAATGPGGLAPGGFLGSRGSEAGAGDGETVSESGVGVWSSLSEPLKATMVDALSAGSSSAGGVGSESRQRLLCGALEPDRPGGEVRRTGLEGQQEGRFLDLLGSSR